MAKKERRTKNTGLYKLLIELQFAVNSCENKKQIARCFIPGDFYL